MDENTIRCLDYGWVRLRNVSGPTRRGYEEFDADDVDVAQSARMSFGQMDSDRTRDQDIKLASYLMKNHHTSPLEMIEVWLEMKLPIFVARQFVRHRTVSINEISGRYVQLPPECYIPDVVGGKPVTGAKQGQSDTLGADAQLEYKGDLEQSCLTAYRLYVKHLKNGVAPEHARLFLHVNHYTHWLWKQDLHNMMHFLSLRDHSHAQVEAQIYAKAIDTLLTRCLPELMALYRQFKRAE
jgi:thymidylate synthase (FAD)